MEVDNRRLALTAFIAHVDRDIVNDARRVVINAACKHVDVGFKVVVVDVHSVV